MTFEEMNLAPALLRAVHEAGYAQPTPIQQQAILPLLQDRDLMGCAQTGTGKTAAFALPILHRLAELQRSRDPRDGRQLRVLVLAPTRELALQIDESFVTYGRYLSLRSTVIFGGVGQGPQVQSLRRGVDILVATPGRLLDLMQQKLLHLNTIDTLVLDEADRMLDMGFVRDVQKIIAHVPRQRQTMLFSATLAPEVIELARGILHDPVHVSVTPTATTVERITQKLYHVSKGDTRDLLTHLLQDPEIARAIVFTRTKHGADKVVRNLADANITALALHGNKSQSQRVRALDTFRAGSTRILVATDIAARGIDVDGVTHVVNYDLPNIPESYVHRIGRTARAGADGVAVAFCDGEERAYLRDIERLIRLSIRVVTDHPFVNRQSTDRGEERAADQRPDRRRTEAAPRPQRHGFAAPSQNSANGSQHQNSQRPHGERQSAPQQGHPQQRPNQGGRGAPQLGGERPEAPRVAAQLSGDRHSQRPERSREANPQGGQQRPTRRPEPQSRPETNERVQRDWW